MLFSNQNISADILLLKKKNEKANTYCTFQKRNVMQILIIKTYES